MATKPKIRGRFYVEHDRDGYTLVDALYGSCVSFESMRQAQRNATFARAYVRKWGEINVQSFPYTLDDPWTAESAAQLHEDATDIGTCRCEICRANHPED
jgi:hypothetical protein